MHKLLTSVVALAFGSMAGAQTVLALTSPERAEGDGTSGDTTIPFSAPYPEPRFDRLDSAKPASQSESAVPQAALSPYTLSPTVTSGHSWARTVAGYDTAAKTFRLRSSAETALTRYLALRLDFEHGPSTSTTERVSLGLHVQLLNQKAHGIDFGAGLFYQPADFRGEGNLVGGLMFGRRFGQMALLGTALFGSDPEGDDQEIDGRLGTQVRLTRLFEVGLDTRFRSVISNDAKKTGTSGVDWEMALLPDAVVQLGSLVLIGEAGFSALQTTSLYGEPYQRKEVRTGVIVMSGLGAAF
jgi:hypothetical protein